MHEQFKEIPDLPSSDLPPNRWNLPRIARKLSVMGLKRAPANLFNEVFPSPDAKYLAQTLGKHADLQGMPGEMVEENMVVMRDRVMILANRKVHPDMWFRDYMLISEFLNNPSLDQHVLRSFERKQQANGQIPTAIGVIGSAPWHFADDETTMLYMIMGARLAQSSAGQFGPNPVIFKRAYDFVEKHGEDGRYVSAKGPRRGWLDAFNYPKSDVITQNQGLYSLALMAAERSGLRVERGEIDRAISNYRLLVGSRGYPVLSARFDHSPESSGLYPEYLGITIFDREMLKPSVVASALETLPLSKNGYKILCKTIKGDYFDPTQFIGDYQPGEYQNGGVWPIWDNNLRIAGELHGIKFLGTAQDAQKVFLTFTEWPESIWTGEGREGDTVTPRAKRQLWNVAIPAQQEAVRKIKQELARA